MMKSLPGRGLVASVLAIAAVSTTASADCPHSGGMSAQPEWQQPMRSQPHDGMQPRSERHPRLGVALTQLTPELRAFFAVPGDRGALVAKVEPGSSAARAGVRVGDILIAIDGNPISDARDVKQVLENTRPQARVVVDVIRERKPLELSVRMMPMRRGSSPEQRQRERQDQRSQEQQPQDQQPQDQQPQDQQPQEQQPQEQQPQDQQPED